MKVINTWDAPEETTMNSRCADCNCEDCRCDRIPMPAAGPWRYDVENAPKEGVILVIAHTGEIRAVSFNPLFDCWTDDEYHVWQYNIDVFATINPPETTP